MNFSDICKRLESTNHVALVAHKNPDGDACGSLEGMRRLIEDNFPQVAVSVVVPPENFDAHVFWVMGQTQTALPENTDLIIILDTSIYTRTALHPSVFDGIETLCIDHHETFPESIGGYVDATASATALILTEQALAHNWQISPEAATALLLGIYTDTGGFIHRNTDARSFVAAAELMKRGADQIRISAEVFGNYPLEYLHDLGK
jgi:phosphoesterase RecJ-like protein